MKHPTRSLTMAGLVGCALAAPAAAQVQAASKAAITAAADEVVALPEVRVTSERRTPANDAVPVW